MAFDAPASAPAAPVDLGPTELLAPTPIEAPPEAPPAPEPAPAPAPAAPVDPFAASGLLDGLSDTPLAALESAADSKFEYNGNKMAPMAITTAQFGQQWGTLASTSPLSANSSKITTLDQYMSLCESIGAHEVEAITQTSEGICAGIVGGTNVALIHGKVSPGGKIDVTNKSSDASMGGVLSCLCKTCCSLRLQYVVAVGRSELSLSVDAESMHTATGAIANRMMNNIV